MAAVRGIGGVVIHAANAASLAEWYETHPGMVGLLREPSGGLTRDFYHGKRRIPGSGNGPYGGCFPSMPPKSEPGAALGISYLVDDLDELVRELRASGIEVGAIEEDVDNRFARLRDPEGHRVILWED